MFRDTGCWGTHVAVRVHSCTENDPQPQPQPKPQPQPRQGRRHPQAGSGTTSHQGAGSAVTPAPMAPGRPAPHSPPSAAGAALHHHQARPARGGRARVPWCVARACAPGPSPAPGQSPPAPPSPAPCLRRTCSRCARGARPPPCAGGPLPSCGRA